MRVAVPAPPSGPPPPGSGAAQTGSLMLGAVMGLQAAALIGAVVTGVLARRRRQEMQSLNDKLRTINTELRRQREQQESMLSAFGGGGAAGEAAAADGSSGSSSSSGTGKGEGPASSSDGGGGMQAEAAQEALLRQQQQQQQEMLRQERSVLEQTLQSPSAPHPTEGFGDQRLSVAGARRQIAQCIRGSKELVRDGRQAEALPLVEQGLQLAAETADLAAERALIRVRARALRETGNFAGALRDLHRSLDLSSRLGESCGAADTYGEMGDVLTELGDYPAAGRYYDMCIAAIDSESQTPLGSTWDA